jgi:hypothetical protein
MPRGKSKQDPSMLAMALVGYELEKKKIDERIREIRALLSGAKPAEKVSPARDDKAPKRRKLSAAARNRIAAAQRKRWAEHRKESAQAG